VAQVHPIYLPAPYQDSAASGRLICVTLTPHPHRPAHDRPSAFFQLSPESRQKRFLLALRKVGAFTL
jgi:hypothetical protein